MRSRRVALRIALAAIIAWGAACAGGRGAVDLGTVPDSPVALLYRDESLALQRLDALRDLEKRGQASPVSGVVRLETLDAMFGGAPEAQLRLRATLGDIALFHPHSGKTEPLPGLPPGSRPLSWSPDRSRLLLAGRWRDAVQLFVWERATGLVEIATAGRHEHPMGCLGPRDRLVAVEAWREAGGYSGRLVATPEGGGGLRPLTPGPSDILPACAPEGGFVAYVTAGPDGALTLAVLDLAAREPSPRLLGRGTDPVFTPDGEWIVYVGFGAQGRRLFRVRPDGTGRTPIGDGGLDPAQPAVSPDGRFVAYVAKDGEDRERLRVRRFDGSGDRPFLTSGDATSPVW